MTKAPKDGVTQTCTWHQIDDNILKLLLVGGDDRRVLLWNVEKSIIDKEEPQVMLKQHLSNIFCLSFDSKNTRIFSAGNDDQAIVHDIET